MLIKQLKPAEWSFSRKDAYLISKGLNTDKMSHADIEERFKGLMAEETKMTAKKTTKKQGKGRIEQVREFLKKNPKASNKDVCTALKLHPSYLFTLKKKL